MYIFNIEMYTNIDLSLRHISIDTIEFQSNDDL